MILDSLSNFAAAVPQDRFPHHEVKVRVGSSTTASAAPLVSDAITFPTFTHTMKMIIFFDNRQLATAWSRRQGMCRRHRSGGAETILLESRSNPHAEFSPRPRLSKWLHVRNLIETATGDS